MAKKTILVCDKCESEGKHDVPAIERVNVKTLQHGTKMLDLCAGDFEAVMNAVNGARTRKRNARSRVVKEPATKRTKRTPKAPTSQKVRTYTCKHGCGFETTGPTKLGQHYREAHS